jgi:hypothetical protein
VVTLHTTEDVLAVPEHEQQYAQQVRRFGDLGELRQLFVERGGNCTSTRLRRRSSPADGAVPDRHRHLGDTSPDRLTATANPFGSEYQQVLDWATLSVGSVQRAFVPYTPGPFLRPFWS